MQKSKFKNLEELRNSFDEVYFHLNDFIADDGIYFGSALYGALQSARAILANVPLYFNQYNYDKD